MTNVYIIGSNRFNDTKRKNYNFLLNKEGIKVQAVGFSDNFDNALANNDYEALHALENKAIEESDLIILVNTNGITNETYVGADTQREIDYCITLGKRAIPWDKLFNFYSTLKKA